MVGIEIVQTVRLRRAFLRLLQLCWSDICAQSLPRQKIQNTLLDLIACLSYRFDPLSFWIWQRPVIAPETGNVGAFVSATHRDQHLSALGQFRGKFLRLCVAQIDPNFTHRIDDYWMDMFRRLRTRRYRMCQFRIGKLIEERGRHLRTAGVMNAGKNESTQTTMLLLFGASVRQAPREASTR